MAEPIAYILIPRCDGNKYETTYDFRELVRCKDCRHSEPSWHQANDVKYYDLYCDFDCQRHTEDWFCANGQRRNE